MPLHFGTIIAAAVPMQTMTSIAPFRDREADVSAKIEAVTGTGLPPIGKVSKGQSFEIAWAGYGIYFAFGTKLDPLPGAAMTDQSDAWAGVDISGAQSADMLARLVPVDLPRMPKDTAARTMLGHMNCLLIKDDDARFRIFVFRSMAGTAAHELEAAMRAIAARNARSQ